LTQENLLIELRLPEADLAVEQFDLEQMVSQAVMAVDSCNNQIERTKTEIKLLQQQQINLTNLMHDKKVQLNNSRQKLAQLTNEREAFNAQNQEQEINNLQQQIQQITLELDDLRHNLDSVVNQSLDLKNQLSTLHNSRQRYQDKINQTQLRHQEQLVLLSTYREQVDTLQLNETELLSLVSTSQVKLSLAELTQQSKLFEAQINELGLVNLKAISDLEQAQQKQQQLFSQLDDLHQAIDLLQTAINHIDEESRELLQTTFSALNQSVAVYFRILFGGGDARLALTDSDILTAGVQIFAQPPGKKNTTIHLLSGGEKALAAMSFVFALFSLNPAPFCLLDEVDAPLDDANTQRFCNLVTELAAKTQFVYISHNRLAMEMATQLVGVTMQEKGVSQIVSVSLVDALSHVNHGG
ncbi:MAG: chromosome segregation protein, partial [Pseudomonadota bacterium]